MLPRTKYNRFRNDSVTSVDDLLHNLSVSGSGGKVSAAAPAATPYLVSGEALRKAPDDGPGSLGHLLHKVSHLKLSSSGLRGLSSAARERAGARLSGSCSAPSLAAPDGGSATPGARAQAASMSASRKSRAGDEPLPRPPRGAPHSSDQVLGPGVTYVVKVGNPHSWAKVLGQGAWGSRDAWGQMSSEAPRCGEHRRRLDVRKCALLSHPLARQGKE